MANWFQVKIRYQVEDEKQRLKTKNETYLLDAVSYTDAEARIYSYIAPNIPDFQLMGLTRLRLSEVFFVEEGAEKWYKVKVGFISFDEKTQQEKKTPHTMMINAANIKEAHDLVVERLGQVTDYEITDLSVTNILEVIPYEEPVDPRLAHGNFRKLEPTEA
jgi:hypothetical protein